MSAVIVLLTRTVWMLCCLCLSLSLSAPPLASSHSVAKRKPSVLAFPASYSLSYNKTNVADMESSSRWQMENWVPPGPRQNHRVSDESRHRDTRHTWPIGVWICPDFCKYRPQLWVKSLGRVKGYRSKSRRVD